MTIKQFFLDLNSKVKISKTEQSLKVITRQGRNYINGISDRIDKAKAKKEYAKILKLIKKRRNMLKNSK